MGKLGGNFFTETASELKTLLRREKNARLRLRLKAALLLVESPSIRRREIAERLGVDKRTMERWFARYQNGGMEKYLSFDVRKSKPSVIDRTLHKALEKKLNDSRKPFLGYWDAQNWVAREFGKNINYQTLRAYLIRNFGSKLKVPRKSHVNKDKQAATAFLKMAQ